MDDATLSHSYYTKKIEYNFSINMSLNNVLSNILTIFMKQKFKF